MKALSRFYPVIGKARSLLRGTRLSLEQAAIKVEEIHPEEIRTFPPVKIFDEDRALISKTAFTSPMDYEMAKIAGAPRRHEAIRRYTFRNVLATPHGFYTMDGPFASSGRPAMAELLRANIPTFDSGFFAPSRLGTTFFAHWLIDGLAMALLRQPHEKLFLAIPPTWGHPHGYVDLLGIDRVPNDYAFFRELSYCPDHGQTTGRHARFATLHQRMQAAIQPTEHTGVFIIRGETGVRRVLKNEMQLAERLEARGFRICSSTDDLPTILNACGGARVVVSLEGSQWSHSLFTARWGAKHIMINPSDRFYCMVSGYVNALGAQMGTVVAKAEDDGYVIDIDRTLKMVDWAEEEMTKNSLVSV